MVFTDVTETAGWRSSVHSQVPWKTRPVLCDLVGDHLQDVALDVMHVWCLGVLRDLLGSILKVLLRRKGYFPGNNIKQRLLVFNKELRKFVKDEGLFLSCKRIKKQTLNWKSTTCPVLFAKAADCTVILKYVSQKLQTQEPPEYEGMVACAWAAQAFSGCMAKGGVLLTQQERDTVVIAGTFFLKSYITLANSALEAHELLWKVRPKLHYLQHLVEGVARFSRNPFVGATFMDEDWIRVALTMKRKMSFRTSSCNVLRRFLVCTKSSLEKHFETRGR